MRYTEGRKGKGVRTGSFYSIVVWILIFLCSRDPISFPKAWERKFLLQLLKTMTAVWAPTISLLAILLLLKPVPVFSLSAWLLCEGKGSPAHGGNTGLVPLTRPASWWCESSCFFSVHVFFFILSLQCHGQLLGTYLLLFWESQNETLNMMWELPYTLRILFWTFA